MRKILSIITIGLLTIVICSTAAFSQTGKWTQLFPTHSPPGREQYEMAYLGGDKILMFGGGSYELGELGDTWIYDLSDNEWTEVKCDSSPSPRLSPAMANIGDGKVLLFGGGIYVETLSANDTWLFDLKTMKWTELHPNRKPYRRYRAACARLGESKVLLYSGDFCPIEYSEYQDGWCHDTWIYDLQKNEWDSITNDYPRGRELAQMCELNEKQIILYGGSLGGPRSNDTYIYDKNINEWMQYYPKMQNLMRCSSAMINLKENLTFVFGGNLQGNPNTTGKDKYGDDSWIFDFADSTWIQIFPEIKPVGRYMHKMAKIGEGKAILFGGGTPPPNPMDDTWIFEYDPTGVIDSNNLLLTKINIIYLNDFYYEIILNNLYLGFIDIELYDINGGLIKKLFSNYNNQKEFNLTFSLENFDYGSYFIVVKTKQANYYKQILVIH